MPPEFNPRVLVLALALFLIIGFSSDATAAQNPDLESGFPVKAYFSMGTYHGGPSVNTLVGNIDGDPALEILVTGTALGPLYAWKATGAPVPGFPIATDSHTQYAGLGRLSGASSPLDVFSAGNGGSLAAYSGSGLDTPAGRSRVRHIHLHRLRLLM